MLWRTLWAVCCVLVLSTSAQAQGTIFLVRHAERADTLPGAKPSTDPSLSDDGRARAASLATVLKDADIRAIFVTEFKRTQETAAPLAQSLKVKPMTATSKDPAALVRQLKNIDGNVLVVGHSNTVPEIIKSLGVSTPVTIGDNDFDNLFVVTPGAPIRFLRLHYR
jgi:broad specificity phosphatase PhoE